MTIDSTGPIDGAITTEAELESAIHEVLISAFENDLDVLGARAFRNGPAIPDWEILVHELSKE